MVDPWRADQLDAGGTSAGHLVDESLKDIGQLGTGAMSHCQADL